MLLWLDIHLPPALCGWIEKSFGVRCTHIRELAMQRTPDASVFARAGEANAVIVTKDRDFADLVSAKGPPPRVLWLTCGNTSNDRLRHVLAVALPQAIARIQAGESLIEINDPAPPWESGSPRAKS